MTIITTPRLLLRPILQDDAPAFARLCDDRLIARNTARIPHPYTIENAKAFVTFISNAFEAGEEYAFAVCEDGDIVACAGISPQEGGVFELGYWVGAEARRRGVAVEAAGAVACFAFEQLGASRIAAGHFTDNPVSGRVLSKLGFKPTGEIVRTYSAGRGGEADTRRMALTSEGFATPTSVQIDSHR